MIFRPLALAAAVAGSIVGLSSAEINYSYQTGEIISTGTVSGESSAAIQLASKSEFCASILDEGFPYSYRAYSSLIYYLFSSRCIRIKGLDNLSLL
jgi:hypothetical protein